MAANTNGLIYYKLDVNKHGYQGDITKNCGLRGEEIDSNFNFLRGQDIKDVYFDENDNLVIVKHNDEKLKAEKTSKPELPNYNFSYNVEDGVLTIIAPNGEETVLSGFAPNVNIYNYHDYTLEGNGTLISPLKINENLMTGRYKPAIKLIDTTIVDDNGKPLEILPSKNVAKNDRYVTKEKISKFGKLYPLSGIELIEKRLNEINSEWRIPTIDDWNTIASNDEMPGSTLKSTEYWKEYDGKLLSEDKYGFAVYPVGYAGNRGKDFYGSFGEETAFWTSTKDNVEKESFVKLFKYDSEKVELRTWGENYLLSLRLVKDFKENNFNSIEVINGLNINCIHIPGTNLIWTKYNIAFTNNEYDGFTPDIWASYENNNDIRYFVNEWDGEKWNKYELSSGDGIVLHEGKFGAMHEWILKDGELVDISNIINIDVQEQINFVQKNIENKVNKIEENVNQSIEIVNNKIIPLESVAHTHNNYEQLNVINENTLSNWNNAKQDAINESIEYTNKEISTLNESIKTKIKDYADEEFLRKDVAEATYVTLRELVTQLKELSDRISVLEGKMEQTISYIEGTGGEISVSKSGNVATVSFDPNAEFEATLEEE